jgi:16S rRNA (guanine527-N7)-methyltransferase
VVSLDLDVSRETYSKLEEYVKLLLLWNKKINLIGKSTEIEAWNRHVLDSYQLLSYLSKTDRVVDLGSGAGVPGLILSILGISEVTLIESDSRKSAFLLKASRVLGLNTELVNARVETLRLECDVVVCRAFAKIANILEICNANIFPRKKILLLKGKNVNLEIENAKKIWLFNYSIYPSIISDGFVLEIDPEFRKITDLNK